MLRMLIVLAAFSVPSYACANPVSAAKEALLEMMHAMGHLNYQGVVVYMRDGKMEPMKIFHAVHEGVEQERVVALNSPLREIIRDGNKVTCYYPDANKAVVEFNPARSSFLISLPEDKDGLDAIYRFDLGGEEHIALRPAQIVHIIPRDEYRYGRRIWMDRETKLPLKFEVIGEDGKVIEQMTFTSLQIEEFLPIKSLHAANRGDKFTWLIHDKEMLSPDHLKFIFHALPDGFRRVLYSKRKMRNGNDPVEHLLFSDGFSSVSVYIDQAQNGVALDDRTVGATNVYTRKLEGVLITVMGEVPLKTVRMIGDGIGYRE